MKCKLNPAIESMSGKCGGMMFKTYKRPNGKKYNTLRGYIIANFYALEKDSAKE